MPRSPLPVRAALVLAAGAGATLASLLGAAPSGAAVSGREVSLTFDGTDLLASSGGAAVDVREVTNNGGTIDPVAGRDGTGGAARFPLYQADTPPQAVVTLADTQGVDDLDPGTAPFTFGAEFALDDVSWGSSTDNGNNLLQRGLYHAATQYKLQVDYARPECRVKGRSGAVTVRSSRAVTPGTWYSAECRRDASTVTLTVTRLDDGTRWTYRRSGATGSMTPSSRTIPMSVGGKVTPTGVLITDDADQFNGLVDNVFLDIS
jgi:hypothetical protein